MEVKEKSKKRELIKSIAIVFLAVLLVLTFFSNTFMNRSLPEVSTEMISSGTINAKIRGSGTVTPNEAYEVIIDQTREVRSVCVKVGDTVAQGDLLFVLGDIESQELQEAQEQLQNLNLEYQKRVLELSKSYASEDREVQKLQEDLQKAIAERDANVVSDAEISYAKGDLKQAESVLSELKDYDALDDEETTEAQAAVTKWSGEVSTAETAVETYEKQLDELESGGSIDRDRQIEDAWEALDQADARCNSEWVAYKAEINALIAAVNAKYETAIKLEKEEDYKYGYIGTEAQSYIEAYLTEQGTTAKPQTPDTDTAERAEDTPEFTDKEYQTAYDAVLAAQKDWVAKKKTLDRLLEDDSLSSGSAAQQEREIRRKLNDAKDDLRRAQRELEDAQDTLDELTSGSKELRTRIKQYESAVSDLTKQVEELEKKKTTYDAAVATVDEKERALTDALSGKDIDKQMNDLDLQAARLNIQKQQELVDKYRKEAVDTEIKANVSGTISAINVTPGKTTSAGSAMAVIDVVDRGYTIKVPVTAQQAKQVKVGDTADVTNYYWGNDITATLEAIAPDPAKPGQGKLLIFRITGEIDAGASITLSIGQKSASFDAIVPKSALRSDTNGDFVLVLTSKSTPLGNRYYATRVDVQILAQDDTSAAVSGVSQNDYVITTASKPLEAGTQVRMVDNA